MIKQQLRAGNVLDERILNLFATTPREHFVPAPLHAFAYSDTQIELAHGQRMMTPLEQGLLLQALQLTGQETVLEVGTGTGYLTALLSQLAKHVISIDCYADFTRSAEQRLTALQRHNVELLTDNAYSGWHDRAPYDIIIFSGALHAITETHRLQLSTGGRLFAITGNAPCMRGKLLQQDNQGQWQEQVIFETNLPPLINKNKQNTFVF
jgi:protein-L-isoaspartate(D-aspartate) O-methyltransferase